MTDWFSVMAAGSTLPADALHDLHDVGFVVIPGPVDHADMGRLADAYDSAVAAASPDDVKVGSTTTRVTDLVNRGLEFDALYMFAPALEAACRIIGRPFRLSTMHRGRYGRACPPRTFTSTTHARTMGGRWSGSF